MPVTTRSRAGATASMRSAGDRRDISASNGREYVHRVVLGQRRIKPVDQVRRIASTDEHVDVPIQLAAVVEQLAAQPRVARDHFVDQLPNGDSFRGGNFDGLAADDLPIGGVEVDFQCYLPSRVHERPAPASQLHGAHHRRDLLSLLEVVLQRESLVVHQVDDGADEA